MAHDEIMELARQGRYDQALPLAQAAAHRAPRDAAAQALAGQLLMALRRAPEAIPYLRNALRLDRDRPEILNNLGAALRSTGQSNEALPLLRRALALVPAYRDARYNLAGLLAKAEAYPEAIEHYEALLVETPDAADIHRALGTAYRRSGRVDHAMQSYKRAIALDPSVATVHGDMGTTLIEAGHVDAAVDAFVRAIALAPDSAEYYRYLAEAKPGSLTDDHVASLERLAANDAALGDEARIDVHFALGKVYDKRGEPARAIQHLLIANAARRRNVTYDEAADLGAFARLEQLFTREHIAARAGCSDPSPVPVFIFGMPRSGTTLIEQILASHPDVYGAGEISLFEDAIVSVLGAVHQLTPEAMEAASCEALAEIGKRYVAALRGTAPASATRISDKMLTNYRFIGLIRIVLPNATLIHARRDAIDTCLSCFSHNFAGLQPWVYDLGELGRYYRAYRRLTQHWRDVLPSGAILDVHYEDVVADLETQARRIVAHCGLDWSDACLSFYTTDRPVRTASATQVRQPIYATSVNRGHAYGELLRPLYDALDGSTAERSEGEAP